jgi:NhaA family Na+:H+ antiporter
MVKGPARATGILRERSEFSFFARRFLLPAQAFIHTTGTGGLLLIVAALVALVWANSPWGDAYDAVWHTTLSIDLEIVSVEEPVREIVNSGLMTLFFFLMGLEVKRELLEGELSEPRKAMLPAVAALGGMLVPVGLYLALNPSGETRPGWGVPMATDIAVADDIGSILVIAIFYTGDLSLPALGAAAALLGLVLALRWSGVQSGTVYAVVGLSLGLAVHASGVHATIAGVALGLLTPIRSPYGLDTVRERLDPLLDRFERIRERGDEEEADVVLGRMVELLRHTEPPLDRMQRLVLPWSSFVVLPLFALANAGIDVTGETLIQVVRSPAAHGIVLGLVVGKLAGILGASWAAVRLGFATLPGGVHFRHIAGVGLTGGIGFTVSIFIANLAFNPELVTTAKLAVLAASVIAGIAGYLVLRLTPKAEAAAIESQQPQVPAPS